MSITSFTFTSSPEIAPTDLPVEATNVRRSPSWDSVDRKDSDGQKLDDSFCWLYDTHEGRVISTRERNGYDDSDFYAFVLDYDGTFKEIMYATTRCWTYPAGASIDATTEILCRHMILKEKQAEEDRVREAARIANLPEVGKLVKVVRGRKVAIGTIAEVVAHSTNAFAPRRDRSSRLAYSMGILKDESNYDRVCLRLAEGITVWTARTNLQIMTEEEIDMWLATN